MKEFGDAAKAVHYGDECWSRVLMNWENWRTQGLTQHRNWWPEAYRQYCEKHGRSPDPAVLAYSETYQTTRADLKNLSASA